MARRSNNNGCGCFFMLLILGAGGYWGYDYFVGTTEPSEQNEENITQIAPSKANQALTDITKSEEKAASDTEGKGSMAQSVSSATSLSTNTTATLPAPEDDEQKSDSIAHTGKELFISQAETSKTTNNSKQDSENGSYSSSESPQNLQSTRSTSEHAISELDAMQNTQALPENNHSDNSTVTPASTLSTEARPTTPLHTAVIAGKPSAVKKAIADGYDLEARDSGDMTPLMVAAMRDRSTSARLLLQAGANPNAANSRYGTSALMLAAMKGHHEVVTELIRGGVNINATNKAGCTALMLAAREGHAHVVYQLEQAGANTNMRDSSGRTARDYAIANPPSQVPTYSTQVSTPGGLTAQQARTWAERCWRNYDNNDLSYMHSFYDSKVHVIKYNKTLNLERYIHEYHTYSTSRWPYRHCTPHDYAWSGNRVEIRYTYSITDTKGSTTNGYAKTSYIISPRGRIQAVHDQASIHSHIPFSPGLTVGF